MWQPFGKRGVPLRLNSPGVIKMDGQRAAVLICYEQVLTYPIVASMLQSPTVLVGISNMYWFADTPMPRYQESALRAWAKLFNIPYLVAENT
jgi:apolipoprotein N-acyltransferase